VLLYRIFKQTQTKIYLHLMRLSWSVLLSTLVFLFAISWLGLLYFEPADSELTRLDVFWWFYYVTGTTTGYGDYAPQSLGGRIVTSLFVMTGGIGLIGAIIAKLVEGFTEFGKKRMRGEGNYSRLQNHFVIIGWHGERTLRMLDLLRGDGGKDYTIVLCADQPPENPRPETMHYVRGTKLGSAEILTRAGVATAQRIIIDCPSDDQTLAVGIAVSSLVKTAHIVAYFESRDYANLLEAHNPTIESIVSISAELMTRAALDRGSSRLHKEMLSSLHGPTQFRLQVPESFTGLPYLELFNLFKQHYNATLLGIAREESGDDLKLNTQNDLQVLGGCYLYFMAPKRLRNQDIDWASLSR